MNRARILAAATLLMSTALPACNGLHTPSPAEQGAKKITQVTAKARGISSRITYSPDAVSKSLHRGSRCYPHAPRRHDA